MCRGHRICDFPFLVLCNLLFGRWLSAGVTWALFKDKSCGIRTAHCSRNPPWRDCETLPVTARGAWHCHGYSNYPEEATTTKSSGANAQQSSERHTKTRRRFCRVSLSTSASASEPPVKHRMGGAAADYSVFCCSEKLALKLVVPGSSVESSDSMAGASPSPPGSA